MTKLPAVYTLALVPFALGLSPNPALTVLLLLQLLSLYKANFARYPILTVLQSYGILVLGLTIAYVFSIRGLHTNFVEFTVGLGLASCVFALVPVAVFTLDGLYRSSDYLRGSPIARMLGFPMLWTTVWAGFSRISPLGRQGTWTFITPGTFIALGPLIRYLGPNIVDFLTAFTAVLLLEAFSHLDEGFWAILASPWYTVEPAKTDSSDLLQDAEPETRAILDENTPLLRPDPASELQTTEDLDDSASATEGSGRFLRVVPLAISPISVPHHLPTQRSSSQSERSPNVLLSPTWIRSLGLVLFLSIFVYHNNPPLLPVPSVSTHTALSLACVLPPSASVKEDPLDAFLTESRRLAGASRVHLWPEGAITSLTRTEFEEALKEIKAVAKEMNGWIGAGMVGPSDALDDRPDRGGMVMRKNAVLWVGPQGEVIGEYEKSSPVPLVESFYVASNPNPPPLITLEVPPPRGTSRKDWSTPKHNFTRSVGITSLICNDLHYPRLLYNSLASLVFVSSSTPISIFGKVLLAQAQSRAIESQSTVLVCDGSPTGLSGLVDPWGRVSHWQVGGSSWTDHVYVSREGKTRPAAFERWGEGWIVGTAWVGWLAIFLIEMKARGVVLDEPISAWFDRARTAFGRIRGRTRESEVESLI